MKPVFLVLAACLAVLQSAEMCQNANAALAVPLQTADGYDDSGGPYTVSAVSQTYTSIVGTGTQRFPGDDGELDVNIGFDFNFYGINYSDLQLNGNGHVYLGTGYNPENNYINGANSNSAHPEENGGSIHANYSGPRIDFYWDDTDSSAGGAIYSETRGAVGSREFVIEYDDVPPWSNSLLTSVQMVLQEGTNEITFNYLDINGGGTARNGLAIGIQGSSTDYLQYGWFPGSNAPLSGNGIPDNGESLLFAPLDPATLQIDTEDGDMAILGGGQTLNLTSIEISSPTGSLDPVSWVTNNLDAQDFDADGPGIGQSWETLNATQNQLIEAFLLGDTPFDPGVQTLIGTGYDFVQDARNVVFRFSSLNGGVVTGLIEYTTGIDTVVVISSDFDFDGDVDGDDFLIWQAGFGIDDRGDADGDGDTDGDDFLIWQAQFEGGSGSGAAGVPEPGTFGLAGLMLAGLAIGRFRRNNSEDRTRNP